MKLNTVNAVVTEFLKHKTLHKNKFKLLKRKKVKNDANYKP